MKGSVPALREGSAMGECAGAAGGDGAACDGAGHRQLQCCDQLLQEKSSMGENAGVAGEPGSTLPGPGVFSYNAGISSCEKGLRWENALELLATIEQCAMVPDCLSYNAAITSCEKGRGP